MATTNRMSQWVRGRSCAVHLLELDQLCFSFVSYVQKSARKLSAMGKVLELIREIRKLPKFPGPLCTWEHSLSGYGICQQSQDGKSNWVFKSVLLDTMQSTCFLFLWHNWPFSQDQSIMWNEIPVLFLSLLLLSKVTCLCKESCYSQAVFSKTQSHFLMRQELESNSY